MRVLVIPDIHQELKTLNEIDKFEFDEIVFLGDAVDSHYLTPPFGIPPSPSFTDDYELVIHRLSEVKQKYGEKFHWLAGNHDIAYFPTMNYEEEQVSRQVSSHQHKHHEKIKELFVKNWDSMDVCCELDGIVYSHAGFSKTYINSLFDGGPVDIKKINDFFHDPTLIHAAFDHRGCSPSGNDCESPCTWIRPQALISDIYFKNQVVGHTGLYYPVVFKSEDYNVLIVDTTGHDCSGVIVDGNMDEYFSSDGKNLVTIVNI